MEKVCRTCAQTKPVEAFHRNKRTKDGYSSQCSDCTQAYQKQWYARNRTKRRAQISSYDRNRYERNRDIVYQYLLSHSCVDCKIDDIRVLQFDHRDGKIAAIFEMVFQSSIEKLTKEMAKCDVRCANCHTIRTGYQREYWWTKLGP